jgi:penicillin-binding protein 1A
VFRTGVWVGGEERSIHFPGITYGQGAAMALPIWGLFMKSCYADETLSVSKAEFDRPEDLSIEVDCDKYNENLRKNKNPLDDLPEIDF